MKTNVKKRKPSSKLATFYFKRFDDVDTTEMLRKACNEYGLTCVYSSINQQFNRYKRQNILPSLRILYLTNQHFTDLELYNMVEQAMETCTRTSDDHHYTKLYELRPTLKQIRRKQRALRTMSLIHMANELDRENVTVTN